MTIRWRFVAKIIKESDPLRSNHNEQSGIMRVAMRRDKAMREILLIKSANENLALAKRPRQKTARAADAFLLRHE
jgi:hypothetical protein